MSKCCDQMLPRPRDSLAALSRVLLSSSLSVFSLCLSLPVSSASSSPIILDPAADSLLWHEADQVSNADQDIEIMNYFTK